MNVLEFFLNFFNPTEFTIFYPLLVLFSCFFLEFCLSFWDPKNRLIYIFRSIPKILAVLCVSNNALWQLSQVIYSALLFQAFVLIIGMLMLGGIISEFKVKYMYVSHYITLILHACFQFYCTHYDAGVINKAFHPTFEYLVLLVIVYSLISSFVLLDHIKVGLSVSNRFLDLLIPTNETNSHTFIVLLQAYSMIIHSTFMAFMYRSTLDDYWSFYAIALFVALLQLIILIMSLRIMHVYPASANTPFYVSAYVMIIKTLVESAYTNYIMFKENTPCYVQPPYFYNQFIYLSAYLIVISILSCDVAYALDEPGGPITESNIFNRISISGASKLFVFAGFYEGVSMFREWLEGQGELPGVREDFSAVVEACHNAKSDLEQIKFKYPSESELVAQANLTLKKTTMPSQLSLDDLKDYTKDLNSITIEMGAKYDVYKQYENNPTDYITRRLWNIKNCWGSRK